MIPEQLFEQLSAHLEQHVGTMTQAEVQMWSNKIYSLKRHTDSMLEDFSLREIAFLQFFASDLDSLTLKNRQLAPLRNKLFIDIAFFWSNDQTLLIFRLFTKANNTRYLC